MGFTEKCKPKNISEVQQWFPVHVTIRKGKIGEC
jgi:hypothetical protein